MELPSSQTLIYQHTPLAFCLHLSANGPLLHPILPPRTTVQQNSNEYHICSGIV